MTSPAVPPILPPGVMLARDAWRLGVGAIRAMPNLFGGTFVLLLVFELAFRWRHPPSDGWPSMSELLLGFANDLASDVIAAAAMVAVHRSILLGEGADRPVWRLPPGYDRYLGRLVALSLPSLAATAALGLVDGRDAAPAFALAALILVLLATAAVVVSVRLALALPLAAADVPGAGWRTAWEASRGKGWRLFGIVLLTFVPMEAAAMLVAGLFQSADGLAAVLLDSLGAAAKALLWAAIGAALWSRLLQAYGGALARPPVWR
ncbi:MAG TPA: hypothetical protein VGC15_03750 [Acetobacteraceae bacterium]